MNLVCRQNYRTPKNIILQMKNIFYPERLYSYSQGILHSVLENRNNVFLLWFFLTWILYEMTHHDVGGRCSQQLPVTYSAKQLLTISLFPSSSILMWVICSFSLFLKKSSDYPVSVKFFKPALLITCPSIFNSL